MEKSSRLIRPLASVVVALALVLAAIALPSSGTAQTSVLGTAASFSVLAGSTVTNTGPSVVDGDLGVSPGSAVTGFDDPGGPGVVNGTIHIADEVSDDAQSDLTTAYNDLAGRAVTEDLTGDDLGGLTLTPGVYSFDTSAQLTGTLTLNAQENPDAEFIFQIGSTLTTAPNASVNIINGHGGSHCNVYWQVGSSATLDTNTVFQGNIVALTDITLVTGTDILGRPLARNGAVTMDTNTVSNAACITGDDATPTPTPVPGDDATPTPTPVPGDDATPTPTPAPDDGATPTPTPAPDDGNGTTPDDDDDATAPDDDDDATAPDDDDDATAPDDDDETPANGDKGESPSDGDGKITLPKTGTAGFLAETSQRVTAPSILLAAAVLLLIGGGVYFQQNRHRFQ